MNFGTSQMTTGDPASSVEAGDISDPRDGNGNGDGIVKKKIIPSWEDEAFEAIDAVDVAPADTYVDEAYERQLIIDEVSSGMGLTFDPETGRWGKVVEADSTEGKIVGGFLDALPDIPGLDPRREDGSFFRPYTFNEETGEMEPPSSDFDIGGGDGGAVPGGAGGAAGAAQGLGQWTSSAVGAKPGEGAETLYKDPIYHTRPIQGLGSVGFGTMHQSLDPRKRTGMASVLNDMIIRR